MFVDVFVSIFVSLLCLVSYQEGFLSSRCMLHTRIMLGRTHRVTVLRK